MNEAITTLIAGIVPALITGLVGSGFLTSEYFKTSLEPNIILGLKVFEQNNQAKLEINNFGKSPATNFTLFFNSPEIVKEIKNVFSIENIEILDN